MRAQAAPWGLCPPHPEHLLRLGCGAVGIVHIAHFFSVLDPVPCPLQFHKYLFV